MTPRKMGIRYMTKQWVNVCKILKARLGKSEFDKWFATARPREFSENHLVLEVGDAFSMKWIRSNYLEMLKDILWDLYGRHLGIDVSVGTDVVSETSKQSGPLTSRYTFDRFVTGTSNELAFTAALQAARMDPHAFNPLFIHGGVGMGKTHLLQAISHFAEAQGKHRPVYVSAETLVNEVMTAVKKHDLDAVRRKYRGEADILIVDDIQFIAKYPKANFVQSEFFHTFNELHGSGRQIVLSSDQHPNDLPQIEERLHSRFEWGLVVEIDPPDRDTRLRIVQSKVERERIELDKAVIELVVDKFTGSVREIEGAVNKLTAYSLVRHIKMNLPLAKKLLRRSSGIRRKPLSLNLIAEEVSGSLGVSVADMKGPSRQRRVTLARHVACMVSRTLMNSSLMEIGCFYGNRDHSTIISGIRSVSKKIENDPELERAVRLLRERLNTK